MIAKLRGAKTEEIVSKKIANTTKQEAPTKPILNQLQNFKVSSPVNSRIPMPSISSSSFASSSNSNTNRSSSRSSSSSNNFNRSYNVSSNSRTRLRAEKLPSGGFRITNKKPPRPNITIKTGNVTQMNNKNFVTTNDLQKAVQSATSQTLNYIQAGGIKHYL